FWSLTKNDGVRSLLKGDNPFHSRPAFLSRTRLPTTSDTGSRARNSSRNCGGKRMAIRRFRLEENESGLYYTATPGPDRRNGACPGFPQASSSKFPNIETLESVDGCIYKLYIARRSR